MHPIVRFSLAAVCAGALSACGSNGGGSATTRDSIRAVGSSTVYPFAKVVAENFAKAHPDLKSPIVESTGTGAGIELFCKGIGANTPDIADASRRMKASEFDTCKANGASEIVEIQIGLDGLAFASAKSGIAMNLTPAIVYRALAAHPFGKDQAAKTWHDVDPSLPAKPILVYGPPSTSGTRDALKELILTKGCESDPAMAALAQTDKVRHEQLCTEVRSDGAYVDSGEQDNLIVQKIESNPDAIGLFGYSYLNENADRLKGLTMNGIAPTYATIADFSYPGARPLFIYVKKQHLDAIPGLREFIAEWAKSWGKDGPLAAVGFVSAPAEVQAASARAASEYPLLTADGLK